MELIKSPELLLLLKDKQVLLDTNIFVDISLKSTVFGKFFDELKKNGTVIVTIKPVVVEFFAGIANEERYLEKKKTIESIIDEYIIITDEIFETVFALIKTYKEDGRGVSLTDFLLGTVLMQDPENLFLMTKNTTDFPMRIFDCVSVLNLPHHKSIQTYGVYQYKK